MAVEGFGRRNDEWEVGEGWQAGRLASWPVGWEGDATRCRGGSCNQWGLSASIRGRDRGARNSNVKTRTNVSRKLARLEPWAHSAGITNNGGTTVEVVAGWIPTPQRRKGRISRFRAAKLQAGRGGMVVTVVEMVDGEAWFSLLPVPTLEVLATARRCTICLPVY